MWSPRSTTSNRLKGIGALGQKLRVKIERWSLFLRLSGILSNRVSSIVKSAAQAPPPERLFFLVTAA